MQAASTHCRACLLQALKQGRRRVPTPLPCILCLRPAVHWDCWRIATQAGHGLSPDLSEWRFDPQAGQLSRLWNCVHMIIQVKAEGSECPEWAMIELQGEVIKTGGSEANLDPGEPLPIGTLSQGSTADSIFLTIGYHQLEGKRVSLKKPFAILETQRDPEHSGQHVMKVLGVLHHKFLFKTRPRALISKPDGSRQ